MVHENIALSKNKGNKAHVLIGTIVAIGSDAEDTPEIGTANVEIDGYDLVENVPIFYHCEDSEIASSGSFKVDDRVIVLNYASKINAGNMKIVGYEDGLPRYCCLWSEDWEGEMITSNHPWAYLDAASCSDLCCSETPPEVGVITFGENKVLETHVCFPEHPVPGDWGGWCCVWPWIDFDTSPEERINLSELSGFKSQIYIDDLYPSSQSSSGKGHCKYLIWVSLWIYNISSAIWTSYIYGWHCIDVFPGDTSPYGDQLHDSGLSYSELKTKCNSWHNAEQITEYHLDWKPSYISLASPPWGDNNFEVRGIEIYSYVTNMQETASGGYENVESRIIAYFDNLCLY